MPYKDKEKAKEYSKKWREKNKKSLQAKKKIYYQKNKMSCYKRHKKWCRKNKDHVKLYYKNWARKNTLNFKSNKSCALCGWNKHPEILQFHHLNPNEKLRCVKPAKLGMFLKEMEKCILLCPNCHFWKHFRAEQNKTI